jgi:hypothetical protein
LAQCNSANSRQNTFARLAKNLLADDEQNSAPHNLNFMEDIILKWIERIDA